MARRLVVLAFWAFTCAVVGPLGAGLPVSLQDANPPPSPPPLPQEDPGKAEARKAYDEAMEIDDETASIAQLEKKARLLNDAVRKDPTVQTYTVVLQRTEDKLAAARKAVADKQQQDQQQRDTRGRAGRAQQESSNKYKQADEALRRGDYAAAAKAAEEAVKLAQEARDPNLEAHAKQLAQRIAADAKFRKTVWQVLLGLAVAVIVLAVLFLKKHKPTLEMVEGPERGRIFKLEKDVTTIGAVENESDLVIPDPYRKISRRHCQIARSGRHFFLVDCSRNGTFLNGRAVPKNEPVLLRINDEITLSDDVIMIFR